MTVKIEVAPRTTIKAKAATRIVGQVTAGNGIAVTNSAGNFRVALDSDVVQSVVDDENVTGDITSGVLTLGWTGILDTDRGGAGTGTSGYALIANGTGVQSTYQGFTQAGSLTTRTWQDKNRDIVSVVDFGAIPNSAGAAAANLTAINAAVAAHKEVYFPPGNWYVAGTIDIASAGRSLFGAGRDATVVTSTVNNLPLFSMAWGVDQASIRDMSIERNITAISGGDGILTGRTVDNIYLSNLRVRQQYNGFNLGGTGYSRIVNSTSESNISHGILMYDTAGFGAAFQWNLTNINVGLNGGDGIRVDSTNAPGGASGMGAWTHIASFGNTGNAFRFIGASGRAIPAIRINGAFVGGEGGAAGCVVFDTYATDTFPHQISDLYCEAATYGVFATANNGAIQFSNLNVGTMTTAGLRWESASQVTINGGCFSANAIGGIIAAGKLVCNGVNFGDHTGVATQQYGLQFLAGSGPHVIVGNNFSYADGNVIGPLVDVALHAGTVIRGNRGLNDIYPTGTGALDTNYNEILLFTSVASAANEWTLSNAATGGSPTLAATGGDPNISPAFQAKGSGTFNFKATASGPTGLRLFEATGNGTNSVVLTVPAVIGADAIITLPAGTVDFSATGGAGQVVKQLTAGGAFTVGQVDVSAVTGDLAFSNLTQGSALSVLGVTGNATADHASIAAGTDHQVLRRSGTALTFGAVNLAQAAAITGTLPVGNGGTGITSLGTGVATWLGTPSSANLAAAVTGETGSGALVFGTSPTIATPTFSTQFTLTGGTGSVGQYFSGTQTNAGTVFAVYQADYILKPGDTNNAVFGFLGGQVDASNGTVGTAYAMYINQMTKVSTGTITNTYGLFVNPSTSGTNNYGGYIGAPVGIDNTLPKTHLDVLGAIATRVPRTITATSDSMAAIDSSLIFNASGTCTETLLSAASFPGRWLQVKTIANQAVNSASSNVVPLVGGAAGTAILTATAGKWAVLQSDGTNWNIMAAN